MLLFLKTMNIIAILLMLLMLTLVLRQQSSKAQTAFILYNVFTMIFVVGIHLELIHADTVGEALSGLCVQYVGQAGLLMSLLWFASEFTGFFIPAWAYMLEAACNVLVLAGVFTAEKHHFFYSSMKILTDGMYNRIEVAHGILWHLNYTHLYLVVFIILILCAVKYKGSTPIQKKRIVYTAAGIGAMAVLLMIKIAGVFGSYNPIVIAMTFNMFCMMIALVRYSYFDSLHAAVDNAFNHGNEGLIILDGEDRIVFVNHRINELFPDIYKGNTIDRYPEIGELVGTDKHLLYRDSTVYELRVEDIIECGEKNGRMLWFVDQTQTLLTMRKLKEADEAKTQFLMSVSHELRTPMNTILGMNEMILRESGEERIIDYAEKVAGAGEHMVNLIDEVLDASRLENGTLTIVRSPYRIRDVLERAEEMIRPQAEKKGLAFTVEAGDGLTEENRFLIGDYGHILQVLVNLLSNAVKYTDSGLVFLRAEAIKASEGLRLALSVGDTGIGIREEELTQIFENFERGSNAGGKDGMGLGLAIARQLVEAMGGTLTVKSAPGKGSVFVVSLVWEEAPKEELDLCDGLCSKKQDTEMEWPDFHTKTILAADDNSDNLMVLKHLLRRTRAVVETAAGGRSAIEACTRKKYDLILLDHMMPGMDGIAALHRIREGKNGKNRDTKVIALTANAGKEAERMYLEEGFSGYVEKPVDPKKLEQVLYDCFAGEEKTGPAEGEGPEKEMSAEPGWLGQLEQSGIHTREGMRYADMDEEFYRELLGLFAVNQEKQQQKLEQIRQDLSAGENDALWDEWVASCHGLKGEARGLGAMTLGQYFYQMELAGRGRDRQKIEEIFPPALEEWKKAVNGIQSAARETPNA